MAWAMTRHIFYRTTWLLMYLCVFVKWLPRKLESPWIYMLEAEERWGKRQRSYGVRRWDTGESESEVLPAHRDRLCHDPSPLGEWIRHMAPLSSLGAYVSRDSRVVL